jgi:hypothetical protein
MYDYFSCCRSLFTVSVMVSQPHRVDYSRRSLRPPVCPKFFQYFNLLLFILFYHILLLISLFLLASRTSKKMRTALFISAISFYVQIIKFGFLLFSMIQFIQNLKKSKLFLLYWLLGFGTCGKIIGLSSLRGNRNLRRYSPSLAPNRHGTDVSAYGCFQVYRYW